MWPKPTNQYTNTANNWDKTTQHPATKDKYKTYLTEIINKSSKKYFSISSSFRDSNNTRRHWCPVHDIPIKSHTAVSASDPSILSTVQHFFENNPVFIWRSPTDGTSIMLLDTRSSPILFYIFFHYHPPPPFFFGLIITCNSRIQLNKPNVCINLLIYLLCGSNIKRNTYAQICRNRCSESKSWDQKTQPPFFQETIILISRFSVKFLH